MKNILCQLILLTLFSNICFAQNEIPKWCLGERILYSEDDMTVKGYSRCGELKAGMLCDTTGHKVYGNIPEHGIFKDCTKGPRITIIKHHLLSEPVNNDDFTYNEYEPQFTEAYTDNSFDKNNNFKEPANSNIVIYEEYSNHSN